MSVFVSSKNTSSAASSQEGAVDKLIKSWGFNKKVEVEESLYEHAGLCVELSDAKIGKIISHVTGLEEATIQQSLTNKPKNLLTLEYITQQFPKVKPASQRILAISRRFAFFTKIDARQAVAGFKYFKDVACRQKLDQINALPLLMPNQQIMLVFSDFGSLLNYSQQGDLNRKEDPLRKVIGDEPLYGLTTSASIALLNSEINLKSDELAQGTVLSNALDNVWSSVQATTESERILTKILDEALSKKATDVDFHPLRDGTVMVRIRIHGDMHELSRNAHLSPDIAREITNFLITKSRAGDGARLRNSAGGQFSYKNSDLETFIRCSYIPADRYGVDFDMIGVSMRLMPRTSRNIKLKDLNLGEKIEREVKAALLRSQGLIVLAGPTNSGKSTSIAGIVGAYQEIYGNSKKLLSLEDPVERYLDNILQITVENNFAELIRALLRHDPDLIWVGEIRDSFSSSACVRASTSGHVVLSTVHANDSVLAFRAISNYLVSKSSGESSGAGASVFDLAESLSLIIGQRLVKRLCPHCKQEHKISSQDLYDVEKYLKAEGYDDLLATTHEILKTSKIYKLNEKGCEHCAYMGSSGEIPINEILPATKRVRELFALSETNPGVFSEIRKHRVLTLNESALARIQAGQCSLSTLFV